MFTGGDNHWKLPFFLDNLHSVHNKEGWSFIKIMRYDNLVIIPISFPFFKIFLFIEKKTGNRLDFRYIKSQKYT